VQAYIVSNSLGYMYVSAKKCHSLMTSDYVTRNYKLAFPTNYTDTV